MFDIETSSKQYLLQVSSPKSGLDEVNMINKVVFKVFFWFATQVVQELELTEGRLRYSLLFGVGPAEGWEAMLLGGWSRDLDILLEWPPLLELGYFMGLKLPGAESQLLV